MDAQFPKSVSTKARRWIAPLVVIILMAAAYAAGVQNYISLQAIAENRDTLKLLATDNLALALLAYVVVYITAVALSLPGAVVLTVAGGLLFGWLVGGLAAIFAATIGAALVFQIARSSFGSALERRAGPFLAKLKNGFAADAFNYLLFLRLVPLFPFWLVNIAPALANVKLRIFVLATALGIIPGTFAFAFVGAGLDSVIDAQAGAHATCLAQKPLADCPFTLSLSALVTPELLYAFAALGCVALIPVGLKKWKSAR
jgi:uncharacterized membrane protein YdjX (TVP38/TMEM64 family)